MEDTSREDLILVVFLPFVGLKFNCISRVLMRQNIKTAGLLHRKDAIFLWLVTDDLWCVQNYLNWTN
jgi:hypothetical protein